MWGDEITVTVSFYAKQSNPGLDRINCIPYPDYGYHQWAGSITATFTITQFKSGSVTIPFPATDIDRFGGSIDLSLIISGEVTG